MDGDGLFDNLADALKESTAEWLGVEQEQNRNTANTAYYQQGYGAVHPNGSNMDQNPVYVPVDYTKYFVWFGGAVVLLLVVFLLMPKASK